MGKIIALGGGEMGRQGTKKETIPIDREIIRLTGKKHPKLLFLPTASGDALSYVEVVKKYFGDFLGCRVSSLLLLKERLPHTAIRTKILGSDIVYVGGGNTLRMMRIWRKQGVDKILQLAYKKGIVLSGLSAGAICWFRYGNSDSRKFKNPTAPLIKVKGLDLYPLLLCPHYHQEKGRVKSLKQMMKKTGGMAIALDNCSALEIVEGTYRILTSHRKAKAYKAYWDHKKYCHQELKPHKDFSSLSLMLRKK
jgi:dipeptidase E